MKPTLKAEYEKDLHDPDRIKAREIAQLKTDFVSFVEQDWFPICINNGERKPKTVAFYASSKKNILAYFNGKILRLCFINSRPKDIQSIQVPL